MPYRWTVKPPPGTDLDRTYTLCPDYCWPLLGPETTLSCISRAATIRKSSSNPGDILAGSSKLIVGKYGYTVRHNAIGDRLRLMEPSNASAELDKMIPVNQTKGGSTLFFHYRKTDATLRSSNACGLSATSLDFFYGVGGLPSNDTKIYFCFGGFVEGSTQLSFTPSPAIDYQKDNIWAFTTGSLGMRVYCNGILIGSNGATPTRSTNSPDGLAVPATAPNVADLAEMAFFMFWKRQLNQAEIISMTVNPWQVFMPGGKGNPWDGVAGGVGGSHSYWI